MAYRKKSRSPRRVTRRRRVGAVSSRKLNVQKILGAVAGVVAPQFISQLKIGGTTLTPTVVGLVSVGAGVLLPRFVKGDFGDGLGLGLIGGGGTVLLKEYNVISGIPIIAGWQDMKIINGPGSPAFIDKPAANNTAVGNTFRPSASQRMNAYYDRRGYSRDRVA